MNPVSRTDINITHLGTFEEEAPSKVLSEEEVTD
jgi:hypothetical protein